MLSGFWNQIHPACQMSEQGSPQTGIDDPSLMTRPISRRSQSMQSPDGRARALNRSKLELRKDRNSVGIQSDFFPRL